MCVCGMDIWGLAMPSDCLIQYMVGIKCQAVRSLERESGNSYKFQNQNPHTCVLRSEVRMYKVLALYPLLPLPLALCRLCSHCRLNGRA